MIRDDLAKWKKVRKLEPKDAFCGRRLSVRMTAEGNSGPDPNKEPC